MGQKCPNGCNCDARVEVSETEAVQVDEQAEVRWHRLPSFAHGEHVFEPRDEMCLDGLGVLKGGTPGARVPNLPSPLVHTN
jgi:hypothetical protein